MSESETLRYLDLEKLRRAERQDEPFQHVLVPEFLKPERVSVVNEDFPAIERAGNFPVDDLDYGRRFSTLIDEIGSESFRRAIEEKFDVALEALERLITVRDHSHRTDGTIHTDAPAKKVTALIYLNPDWGSCGGRLRLLRGPDDIEDYFAEVPPIAGTLLVFRRSDNSWHGHKPFVGPRRTVQISWVDDAARASKRYRPVSATLRIRRWLGLEA